MSALEFLLLRPDLLYLDGSKCPYDFQFPINASIADVVLLTGTLEQNFVLRDSKKNLITSNMYLLHYVAQHANVIYVDSDTMESPPVKPGTEMSNEMPIERLPESALQLNTASFIKELSYRLEELGMTTTLNLYSSRMEPVPHDEPNISNWMAQKGVMKLIVIPTGVTFATSHNEGFRDPSTIDQSSADKEICIELKHGIKVSLPVEHFQLNPDGFRLTKVAAASVQEFLSDILQTFGDEKLAENMIDTLKTDYNPDSVMCRMLARMYLDQRNKVRELERRVDNRIVRYARNSFRLIRNTGGRVGGILYWLLQQELTMCVLYSLSWILVFELYEVQSNMARVPIYVYLGINVFYFLMKRYARFDVLDWVMNHCFPLVYPDSIALKKEIIRDAAIKLRDGTTVNNTAIIDSIAITPSLLQLVVLSFFSFMPSMYNKWVKMINERREMIRVSLDERIKNEIKNLETENSSESTHSHQESVIASR